MRLKWEHKDGTADVVAVVAGCESKLLAKAAMALLPITCTTCKTRPAAAVAAVPFMATSEPVCETCAAGDAIPWDLCVANTACLGGRWRTRVEWQRIIEATCYLNKQALAEFDRQVAQAIADVAAAMQAMESETNNQQENK